MRVKVAISARHEKIDFREFEFGLTKHRLLEGHSEDSDDWRIGHPIVFPNMLAVGNGDAAGVISYAAMTNALSDGYATSLLGRRRPTPEIRASNRATRSLGERLRWVAWLEVAVVASQGRAAAAMRKVNSEARRADLEHAAAEKLATAQALAAALAARDGAGDARGGAALSVVGVVGVPIAFVGTGERIQDLEPFHADRVPRERARVQRQLQELLQGEGERREHEADRDVEPEDPVPGDAADDGAADERAEGDREPGDPAPRADERSAPVGRHARAQDGERQRGDDRATDALSRTGGDEHSGKGQRPGPARPGRDHQPGPRRPPGRGRAAAVLAG